MIRSFVGQNALHAQRKMAPLPGSYFRNLKEDGSSAGRLVYITLPFPVGLRKGAAPFANVLTIISVGLVYSSTCHTGGTVDY